MSTLPAAAQVADLSPYQGIVLVSFGGPERIEEVMPFLRTVTRGRGIPDERLAEVAEHYYHRGGRSPINDENRALLAALQGELGRRGVRLPLLWGNRHAPPTIDEAFGQARERGLRRLVAVVTSAYSSYSSCRAYREEIGAAAERLDLDVQTIRRYHNHPGFSRTVADLVIRHTREVMADLPGGSEGGDVERRVRLVFVTHSIPLTMDAASGPPNGPGHVYRTQHETLAAAISVEVGRALGVPVLGDLAYCSRSGPPSQQWLEPDVNDHLRELAASGVRAVVLVPFGFVADHMEVVYDLDEEAMQTAAQLGLHAVRVPTVRTEPGFVRGLVDLLEERAAQARGESVSPATWPPGTAWPAQCWPDCCPAPKRPGAGDPPR